MASEDTEAEVFMLMLRLEFPEVELFTYHTPNEGKHNPRYRQGQVKRGLKSGVPDYHVAYPCGGYPGLFIELKKPGGGLTKSGKVSRRGEVSESQREWLSRLREVGFATAVCWGAEEAMEAVRTYLEGRYA